MWLNVYKFYFQTEKDAFCNNTVEATGKAGPYCIIPSWNSTNDLYLVAKAGDVGAISFSIDIDMQVDKKVHQKVKMIINSKRRKNFVLKNCLQCPKRCSSFWWDFSNLFWMYIEPKSLFSEGSLLILNSDIFSCCCRCSFLSI